MDKAHILREIKRTAEANGGVPLGRSRFLAETGIRESDWLGKFWARWSEAILEAGFTPNQLQEAYELPELLEKYARLALELGRLPTAPDLRLKARAQPDFPSSTTFGRLMKKDDLIARLKEYCLNREEFAPVARLCEEYKPRHRSPDDNTADSPSGFGFVYLLKSGRYYKIGKTNSVGRREYELGIQLPERAETVHAIRTDDPTGIEAYWHQRFAAKRLNGEWFELEAADIAAFRRRKFM